MLHVVTFYILICFYSFLPHKIHASLSFPRSLIPILSQPSSSCCCTYIHTYLIYPHPEKPFSQNEKKLPCSCNYHYYKNEWFFLEIDPSTCPQIDSHCVLISTFRFPCLSEPFSIPNFDPAVLFYEANSIEDLKSTVLRCF